MLHQCKERNDSTTCIGPPTHNRLTLPKKWPLHLSMRTLLGSTDQEILDVAEHIYGDQYEMAPNMLPKRLQDQFMAKLHEELSICLVRAGLQSALVTAQSLPWGRSCSWAHSSSHARSPSAEGRMKKIPKQPRGDSLSRNSKPHSRGCRNTVQQQSLLPEQGTSQQGTSLGFQKVWQAYVAIPKSTVPTPQGWAMRFLVARAQDDKTGWWNAPSCQSGLRQWDFIL